MSCVHHWRIESPNGTPRVLGTCQHCGAERWYKATIESEDYDMSTEHTIALHRPSASQRRMAEERNNTRVECGMCGRGVARRTLGQHQRRCGVRI